MVKRKIEKAEVKSEKHTKEFQQGNKFAIQSKKDDGEDFVHESVLS